MASLITTLNTSLLASSSSISLRLNKNRSDICSSSSCQPSLLSSSSSSFAQPSCRFSQMRMMNQQIYLQKQQQQHKTNKRGLLMVTRAAPTTTNLIFAFVFPLSLILITVFASLRIADKLDQDFLEELAINQTIMEGKDEDGESPALPPVEEKPAVPRTRNRPKRQA